MKLKEIRKVLVSPPWPNFSQSVPKAQSLEKQALCDVRQSTDT